MMLYIGTGDIVDTCMIKYIGTGDIVDTYMMLHMYRRYSR